MRGQLKRSGSYETIRFVYRQFAKEPHYPPPLLERLICAPFSALEKAAFERSASVDPALALPQFLGLGAMQSGTSWLFGQLRQHPQVYVPDVKELHYFSWHFHRSLYFYSRQFHYGRGRVCGEISTEYLQLPDERIRFVRRLIPGVRLFVMLRNPVDRAWAHARQALMFRRRRRYGEVPEAEFIRHFRSEHSRTGNAYLSGIDRWLRYFPADQLYVGYYDDIELRPTDLYTDICRHIGISPALCGRGSLPLSPLTNVDGGKSVVSDPQDLGVWSDRLPAPIPERLRTCLLELYCSEIDAMAVRLGAPAARWRCDQTVTDIVARPHTSMEARNKEDDP